MNCPPVLFICQSPQNGDAHWRVTRPATRLREDGVDAEFCWLGPDQMPTVPVDGRVVVLQRVIVGDGEDEAARAWTARLREAGALAVVSDLDDDEVSGSQIDHTAAAQPISQAGRAELERQVRGHRAMLRAVDGVTVSTEPLAAIVRRYTDKPVHVVPNAIDIDWFRERLAPQPIDPDHLTIGWCGWRRPDADLAPMAEAWARIAARYTDVRFVVAGHQSDVIYRQDIPLERIIRLPVAPLDEYPKMYQVDIGCCAVADTPFSRCKTPIKAWEYALAGAAVVATSALYEDCMYGRGDDYTNILWTATSAEAWEQNLADLIEHLDWRQMNQRVMLSHVERHHSLAANLHRWQTAYAEIVASAGTLV